MPISATCRQTKGGFTLLEMLVVLVILASVAGIATPRLSSLYDSSRAAAERDDVLDQIRGLAHQAWSKGETITFSGWPNGEGAEYLALPEGWQVAPAQPLKFLPSGVCLGGELALTRAERFYQYRLRAPYCEVTET